MAAPRKLTLKRVLAAAERASRTTDNPGFCTACGFEHDGCEPDMRNGPCDNCGANKVFGAEELVMMMSF